jgi:hypothetical protein
VAAPENPQCPDYDSHVENAADLLFPGTEGQCFRVFNETDMAAIDRCAEIEYQACEGH